MTSKNVELLVFRIGQLRLAMRYDHIADVLEQPNYTRLPSNSKVITTLITYKDDLIPILEFNHWLGQAPLDLDEIKRIIIFNHNNIQFAIALDHTPNFKRIDKINFYPINSSSPFFFYRLIKDFKQVHLLPLWEKSFQYITNTIIPKPQLKFPKNNNLLKWLENINNEYLLEYQFYELLANSLNLNIRKVYEWISFYSDISFKAKKIPLQSISQISSTYVSAKKHISELRNIPPDELEIFLTTYQNQSIDELLYALSKTDYQLTYNALQRIAQRYFLSINRLLELITFYSMFHNSIKERLKLY